MKNSLGRFVPQGYTAFNGSSAFEKNQRKLIAEKQTSEGFTYLQSISDMFDKLGITDGMTLSFHHHFFHR